MSRGRASAPAEAGRCRRRAVGVVLVCRDRVLLCRRGSLRRWRPGRWDLPGGHVEEGETPPEACVRELREELGIAVEAPAAAAVGLLTPEFHMDVWTIREWRGEPVNAAPREHDAIGWFTSAEAHRLPLALAEYGPLIARALGGGPSGGGAA